jgi:hypothetical protein
MSLKNLHNDLRKLSYTDMMILSEALSAQLSARREEFKTAGPNVLAEILSKLELAPTGLTELERDEEKLLQAAFRRKTSVLIQREQSGWSIGCATIPGSQVIGLSLRPMFPLMIDQIVTVQALTTMGKNNGR